MVQGVPAHGAPCPFHRPTAPGPPEGPSRVGAEWRGVTAGPAQRRGHADSIRVRARGARLGPAPGNGSSELLTAQPRAQDERPTPGLKLRG